MKRWVRRNHDYVLIMTLLSSLLMSASRTGMSEEDIDEKATLQGRVRSNEGPAFMDDNSTGMINLIPMQLASKRALDEAKVLRCERDAKALEAKRATKMPNQELEMEEEYEELRSADLAELKVYKAKIIDFDTMLKDFVQEEGLNLEYLCLAVEKGERCIERRKI